MTTIGVQLHHVR